MRVSHGILHVCAAAAHAAARFLGRPVKAGKSVRENALIVLPFTALGLAYKVVGGP